MPVQLKPMERRQLFRMLLRPLRSKESTAEDMSTASDESGNLFARMSRVSI
jgi:hypothetical protein